MSTPINTAHGAHVLPVTVIIPAFNSNDSLPAALESLHRQTVAHRVVIVDDGSSEPVADVVDTGDALVLRQSNQGPGAARNLGIERAASEVVAFLDADDIWDPTFLERQLFYLDRLPGVAGVVCAPHPPSAEGFVGRRVFDFESTLMSLRGGPGASAWCFRRSALLQAGLFDPKFRRMQDYELLIRMAGQGHTVLRHDEALYRYLPSADRGNRYSIAHQQALERFAEVYGNDGPSWLALRLNGTQRRAIRGLMRCRAMNVAALRGDLADLIRLARQARVDSGFLPAKRRGQVEAALRAPQLYSMLLRRSR